MNYNQPSFLVILLERHVIRITDEILFKMDNDEGTFEGTFVDFRKAFDVIYHKLLLRELSVCGASQITRPGSIISGRATTVC